MHLSACKCTFAFGFKHFIAILSIRITLKYVLCVSRVILGPTAKEACPVGSCHATMVVAVPSPQGEHAAPAQEVMADHSASTAAMTAAPPTLAATEDCALRKQASHTFTASVPVAG